MSRKGSAIRAKIKSSALGAVRVSETLIEQPAQSANVPLSKSRPQRASTVRTRAAGKIQSTPLQLADSNDGGTTQRIIDAATTLFATKGFDGCSTKEICELAQVNIAAIHYHFGSKAELLRQIIGRFGGSRLRKVQSTLLAPETQEEFETRLRIFVKETIEELLEQPELCRIVQTEMELLEARSEDVFRNTLLKTFETLVSFLSHAKAKNFVSDTLEPKIAARVLYSQLCQQSRTDSVYFKFHGLTLRDDEYRRRWLEQTIAVYLYGITGASPRANADDGK